MRSGSAVADPAPAEIPSGAESVDWRRGVGVLTAATVVVSGANYAMSLATARLLPADQFASFAAGQGLLLVVGTGSVAALPWAIARYLAGAPDAQTRGRAMAFGLAGSALQALLLGALGLGVGWFLEGPGFGAAAGLAAALISLLAGPSGYLQGRHRFGALAGVRGVETVARIGATVGLVLCIARRADVALLAFPIGSAVALGLALRAGRDGFPLRRMPRSLAVELSRQAMLLGAVQVLLTMLGALDTVYADAVGFRSGAAASYQAAALLARVPLFFSAAISTASYTRLVAAEDEADVGRQLRRALRTYAWLTVPFIVGCLTLPARVAHVFVPTSFGQTLGLVRILCFSGALIGFINVVTTAHQARARYRSCIALLAAAVVLQAGGLLLAGREGDVTWFAAAGVAVAAATALLLARDCRSWLFAGRMSLPSNRTDRQRLFLVAAAAAVATVPNVYAWMAAMTVIVVACLLLAVGKEGPA